MKYGTFQPHFKLFWQPLIFQFSQFRFVFFHDPLLFRLTFEIPVNNVSNYARFLCQFEFQRVKFGSYFLEFGSKSGIFGHISRDLGPNPVKSAYITRDFGSKSGQIRPNPVFLTRSNRFSLVQTPVSVGFCRFLSVVALFYIIY